MKKNQNQLRTRADFITSSIILFGCSGHKGAFLDNFKFPFFINLEKVDLFIYRNLFD